MFRNRVEARWADAAHQGGRTAISLTECRLFALVAFQSHSDASAVKVFQGNIRDAHLVISKPFLKRCLGKTTHHFAREGCMVRQQWKAPEAERCCTDSAESIWRLEQSKANEFFQYPLTGARTENMTSLRGAI